ncbi:hypothetical protein G6F22_017744 [Rhizopus arrhizus]|nr:hypothetical protein G6F22_017744 [Rhizopus arrhizus]
MARDRGLGLSHWISTGNEADVDVADCIEWLARDADTRVIMTYMEGCRDGDKLRRALSAARDAGKPVVVTKIGRTQAGAQAAASHTAALAGDDAVYDALFRQYGAVRARTIEEFFNLGYALDTWKQLPQGRVAVAARTRRPRPGPAVGTGAVRQWPQPGRCHRPGRLRTRAAIGHRRRHAGRWPL